MPPSSILPLGEIAPLKFGKNITPKSAGNYFPSEGEEFVAVVANMGTVNINTITAKAGDSPAGIARDVYADLVNTKGSSLLIACIKY